MWSEVHESDVRRLEVGPVTELFCEYIWNVEFSCNVEDFYFFKMDAFSDVVLTETYFFHSFFCEGFWPVQTGVVVIVTFGCIEEVNVGQVYEGVS